MNLESTDVKRAFYYRFSDPKSTPGVIGSVKSGAGWYGLFYGDKVGTPKPSAYALRLASIVMKNYPTLKTIATPTETKVDGVYVATAVSNSGKIAILVANNSDTNYAWSPSDVSILTRKTVTVSPVSSTLDGKTPLSHTGTVFQLDPWSVELVEIE